MKNIPIQEVKNILDNLLKVKPEDRDNDWQKCYKKYCKIETALLNKINRGKNGR